MSINSLGEQPYEGYLFVYFNSEHEEGEQVYFSVSKDGLYWKDINKGQPVLRSGIGEKGVRDPFIVRSPLDNKFYIIATDLRIASGKGWDAAQHRGSRSIIIWESTDLVTWSKERSFDVDIPGASCVWAPETVYDELTDEHMIFWASMVRGQGIAEPKQIIYSSRTKDFRTFSKPEIFIERENHVIDATILKVDGVYYRFSKDEAKKCIILDQSKSLGKDTFSDVSASVVQELIGVEGPAIFKFNDRDEWCLMVDQYASGKGYLPLVTNDIASGQFRILNSEEYYLGDNKKSHGSILNLTKAEYDALIEAWG
ncbi:glycoside hydrolase family 43 protein [Paenibacillus tarimensis]